MRNWTFLSGILADQPWNLASSKSKFRQVEKSIHKISTIIIGFGKRPIADFFHDQTICIADCKNLTIGHSLSPDAYLGSTVHYICAKTAVDPGFWSRELWVC